MLLPLVPVSYGVASVSPAITLTRSIDTASTSAATCATTLHCPPPWSATPLRTTTLPSTSTLTDAALSGRTGFGAIDQLETATPIPSRGHFGGSAATHARA